MKNSQRRYLMQTDKKHKTNITDTKQSKISGFCMTSKFFIIPTIVILVLCAVLYSQFIMYEEIESSAATTSNFAHNISSIDDIKKMVATLDAKSNTIINEIATLKEEQKNKVESKGAQELISKKYHTVLLAQVIESKILNDDEWKEDLDLLSTFADKSFQKELAGLKKFHASTSSQKVTDIIAALEAALTKENTVPTVTTSGTIDKLKGLFAKWFVISKVDHAVEAKTIHADIATSLEFLKERNVSASYSILSRLSKHQEIGTIIATMKDLHDAIKICETIKVRTLLND